MQLPHLLGTEEQFKKFKEILLMPLPICFRINKTVPNFHLIKASIDEFAKHYLEETAKEDHPTNEVQALTNLPPVSNIDWVCSSVPRKADLPTQRDSKGVAQSASASATPAVPRQGH